MDLVDDTIQYANFVKLINSYKNIKRNVQLAIRRNELKPNQIFPFACRFGDIQAIQKLKPYCKQAKLTEYLCVACKYGQLNIVKFIMAKIKHIIPNHEHTICVDESLLYPYIKVGLESAYKNNQSTIVMYLSSYSPTLITEEIIEDAILHANAEIIKILLNNFHRNYYINQLPLTTKLFKVYNVDVIELFVLRGFINVHYAVIVICDKKYEQYEKPLYVLELLFNIYDIANDAQILKVIFQTKHEPLIKFTIDRSTNYNLCARLLCRNNPNLLLLKILVDKGADDFDLFLRSACLCYYYNRDTVNYLIEKVVDDNVIVGHLITIIRHDIEAALHFMEHRAYDVNAIASSICNQIIGVDPRALQRTIKDGMTNFNECLDNVKRWSGNMTCMQMLIQHGATNHKILSRPQTISLLNLNCDVNNQFTKKIKRTYAYRQKYVKNIINKLALKLYDINITDIILSYMSYEQ